MSLIKSTQTVGITITGSLTHLHVNFDISIITWNFVMTVFTVKDVAIYTWFETFLSLEPKIQMEKKKKYYALRFMKKCR